MNIKTTLSITEARSKIFKIASKVQKNGLYYTLTQHGRPKVVIMSADEFESWQETMDVMREMPDLKKDIEEAERDYKNGDYITLDELLAEEGFLINKNPKGQAHGVSKKNVVSGSNTQKSKKAGK